MKGIGKIIGFLAVLAILLVSCSAGDDSTGNDFGDVTAANDSRSSIARSAAAVEPLDDAANVRRILGETVTPHRT